MTQEYESVTTFKLVILDCKTDAISCRDTMLKDCWTCIWEDVGGRFGVGLSVPHNRDTQRT